MRWCIRGVYGGEMQREPRGLGRYLDGWIAPAGWTNGEKEGGLCCCRS